jgi:hypothetical protein
VGIDIGRCILLVPSRDLLFLTFRQFEEMQHDNAAQRITLQKAPAKSLFCLQILIYQKALPIGIQYWPSLELVVYF